MMKEREEHKYPPWSEDFLKTLYEKGLLCKKCGVSTCVCDILERKRSQTLNKMKEFERLLDQYPVTEKVLREKEEGLRQLEKREPVEKEPIKLELTDKELESIVVWGRFTFWSSKMTTEERDLLKRLGNIKDERSSKREDRRDNLST